MLSARLRMVRALVARWVDIDAADDLAGEGAEHGIGESAACGEVLCVAFEVAQVLRQALALDVGQALGELAISDPDNIHAAHVPVRPVVAPADDGAS